MHTTTTHCVFPFVDSPKPACLAIFARGAHVDKSCVPVVGISGVTASHASVPDVRGGELNHPLILLLCFAGIKTERAPRRAAPRRSTLPTAQGLPLFCRHQNRARDFSCRKRDSEYQFDHDR